MTMIQKNDVFEFEDRKYRILSVELKSVIWFDLERKNSWPEVIDKNALVELIMSGDVCRIEDPFVAPIHLSHSSEHICRRDKAYETIQQIVEHPMFYDTQIRIELSKIAKVNHKTTDKVINGRLKTFWRYGQSKNALYPKYTACGAPGKQRVFTDKRSGRPRKDGTGKPAISTLEVRRLYSRAIQKFYFKKKSTFSFAFRQFKLLFITLYPDTVENDIPTEAQMRHFYNSEYLAIEKAINRNSDITYRKDVKALVSTSTSQAIGPGSRYEIDATTADIYIVSDDDPNRVLGRPTLYTLMDVFTRLAAGFYIGFETPSYQTVINALVNAAMPKDESLKEIGESDIELWPASGLPEVLLGDKGGEFFGKKSNNLLDIFTIHVENARAYSGDAKAIVERFFGTWQNGFYNIVDGVVTPSRLKKSGESDYRVEANVPLSEFRKLMISGIMIHNHTEVSRSYDRAKDIPDSLPMTPINLWNWGIENRSGALKKVDKTQLISGLLPKATATTSELGLCFEGVYYNIDSLTKDGAFLRKNFCELDDKYTISYNPLCLNVVYVFFNTQSRILTASLHPRSRQFMDMTYAEIKARQKAQKAIKTVVKRDSDTAKARVEAVALSMAKELKKRSKQAPFITASAKISGIKENKKQARVDERKKNAESFVFEDESNDVEVQEDSESFINPSLISLLQQQKRKDAKS